MNFKKLTIAEIDELIQLIENNNPYPTDIWPEASAHIEARFGSFGRMVWNECCKTFRKELIERKMQ